MKDVFEALPETARAKLREKSPPRAPRPMLATLTDRPFSDPNWIFERKLDGERCLALSVKRGSVRLISRNGKGLDATYPEIGEALERQRGVSGFVLDGEVVAFSGKVTSFARLQQRMQIDDRDEARASGVAVYYYVFDLLNLDGYDVTRLGLRQRKSLLRRALKFSDPLRFTKHRNADGRDFFREACQKGWEGLIAKRADSEYASSRSRDWLKLKCVQRQELVIGGFTEPEGERTDFGALLVGYFRDGELVYAGKVGTGYDAETLERLGRRLKSLERATAPFDAAAGLPRKGVHWVTPELVGEVAFTEWTANGRLRHPRFVGLRRDKPAREVVRESARG